MLVPCDLGLESLLTLRSGSFGEEESDTDTGSAAKQAPQTGQREEQRSSAGWSCADHLTLHYGVPPRTDHTSSGGLQRL